MVLLNPVADPSARSGQTAPCHDPKQFAGDIGRVSDNEPFNAENYQTTKAPNPKQNCPKHPAHPLPSRLLQV
jgi:hypothetical protein